MMDFNLTAVFDKTLFYRICIFEFGFLKITDFKVIDDKNYLFVDYIELDDSPADQIITQLDVINKFKNLEQIKTFIDRDFIITRKTEDSQIFFNIRDITVDDKTEEIIISLNRDYGGQ